MPRPATVTELLAIVKEQSATIRMLTEQLRDKKVQEYVTNVPLVTNISPFVPETALQDEVSAVYVQLPERVQDMVRMRSYGDPALREYLETLAAQVLSEGMDEQQVVQMIAQGEQ